MALSLGLNGNVFGEIFGVSVQALRMNYYPTCSRRDLVLGLSPHSDGSILTVLQHANGNPVGLHILKNNTWVLVQPVENALVINIGDTIEVLMNGRYKSSKHIVVTHKDKCRLSIVTFYAPSYGIEIGLMQEMMDENNTSKYRRYNHEEYNFPHKHKDKNKDRLWIVTFEAPNYDIDRKKWWMKTTQANMEDTTMESIVSTT